MGRGATALVVAGAALVAIGLAAQFGTLHLGPGARTSGRPAAVAPAKPSSGGGVGNAAAPVTPSPTPVLSAPASPPPQSGDGGDGGDGGD